MNRIVRIGRPALLVGTLADAVVAVIGLVWLARPGSGIFDQVPGAAMLADMAGPQAATAVQAIVGSVGVVAGIAGLARILPPKLLALVAAVQVLVFGALLQSPMVLNTAGYLLAAAMPVIGTILLIQLFRRYPRARWLVGCPIVIALAVAVLLTHDQIARLAVLIGGGMLTGVPTMLLELTYALIGVCWIVAGAAILVGTPTGAAGLAWVVRHRVAFTYIAAASLLPYGLSRVTWLTPWPQFGGVGIDLPARIWGLTLGSAAWLGLVLTIGLIRPWGEVFPRWMPILAGRRVPIAAAAVPGGAVAAVVCAAAIPWLYAAGRNVPVGGSVDPSTATAIAVDNPILHAVQAAVIIPCWLWGPALALAVIGYVGHRLRPTDQDAAELDPEYLPAR